MRRRGARRGGRGRGRLGDSADSGGSKDRRNTRSRSWNFTIYSNKETFEEEKQVLLEFQRIDALLQALYQEDQRVEYAFWQHEKCPTTGKDHIQGVVGFTSQRHFNALRQELRLDGCKPPHIEETRKERASALYCSKDKSWVHGSVRHAQGPVPEERKKRTVGEPVRDPLAGCTLYEWQREIVELVGTPALDNDRRIHWYVDERGNSGKTTLCKHLMLRSNGQGLYASGGRASDIAFLVNAFIRGGGILRWFLFDFPRSSEGKVSYNAMEQLKNGMMFSPKFESAFCMFNTIHVICFSNWMPDKTQLNLGS